MATDMSAGIKLHLSAANHSPSIPIWTTTWKLARQERKKRVKYLHSLTDCTYAQLGNVQVPPSQGKGPTFCSVISGINYGSLEGTKLSGRPGHTRSSENSFGATNWTAKTQCNQVLGLLFYKDFDSDAGEDFFRSDVHPAGRAV